MVDAVFFGDRSFMRLSSSYQQSADHETAGLAANRPVHDAGLASGIPVRTDGLLAICPVGQRHFTFEHVDFFPVVVGMRFGCCGAGIEP